MKTGVPKQENNGGDISYIPSVSTIGSFFTIAFLFAILMTPSARVTVTTIGRPSGIAATARLKLQKHG